MKKEQYDYEYDCEYKIRMSAELSNVITSHMVEKNLTFEILDLAYESVKDVFIRNATIKKHEIK